MIEQLLSSSALIVVEQGPDQAFFGFIVGALSFVSNLFNKPKAPPTPPPPPPAPPPQVVQVVETKTTPNIQEGVDAAKAAGFNPVTAARNGLIQGFVTQQTPFLTTNSKYVDWQQNYNRELQIQQDQYQYEQQKRSWTSSLFSGAASALSGYGNYRANQVRTGLENDLLRSEISRNNSTTNYNLNRSMVSYGAKTEYYDPIKSTLPLAVQPTGPVPLPPADRTSTNVFGLDYYDDTAPDASVVEDAYGDFSQELYGFPKLVKDTARHIGGNAYDYLSTSYDNVSSFFDRPSSDPSKVKSQYDSWLYANGYR